MIRLLNWLAHPLLALGLVAPCMTITPRMGEHTKLGEWLGLVKAPQTYSILSGIARLFERGNAGLGSVLLVFSVAFPVAKLVVLRVCLQDLRAGRPASRPLRLVSVFGKYSMVDVFVIALLVVSAKTLPGGTTIDVRWGAWAFAAAALLTIPVTAAIKPE